VKSIGTRSKDVLPVQTFAQHMKVAVMRLSEMERPAFQKHTIFSNLFYRSGRKIIK
jgi:hypothetical protein